MTTPAPAPAGETKAQEPAPVKESSPTPAPAKSGEKVVRYIGGAGKRVITKQDWESLRIKDQDTVEFNVINGYELPASDFNAAALRYADKVDRNLKVVEV